ncbi:hypothetical protein GOB87_07585 [Acetobacter estunensis]|uniref:Uncharacterized protein n=1 Tax=Acetobacter estunensis TaxID=104097 RepID=A0A967B7I5_9PROT|nr:hypothetical protein [Acetobacter estunensis]NHO53824.1 hypothetical protein [Acetobacter estunensis]
MPSLQPVSFPRSKRQALLCALAAGTFLATATPMLRPTAAHATDCVELVHHAIPNATFTTVDAEISQKGCTSG